MPTWSVTYKPEHPFATLLGGIVILTIEITTDSYQLVDGSHVFEGPDGVRRISENVIESVDKLPD